MKEPNSENAYLGNHAKLLISSYRRITGKDLLQPKLSNQSLYRALYEAPFGVVSHGTEDDPVFNYGNKTALKLFQMNWEDFTMLPSRKSAEPENREERQKFLDRVSENGFVGDYRGVRISSTGIRFWIEDAIVWNLVNEKGVHSGQAAVFHQWSELKP